MSISVVAAEDWMIAVTTAPEATAARRLRVIAGEQVAQVAARRALQALADELHAVEQQGQAAEQREQRHDAPGAQGPSAGARADVEAARGGAVSFTDTRAAGRGA